MTGWFRCPCGSTPITARDLYRRRWPAVRGDAIPPRWIPSAIAVFLALGCGLRIFRYAQNLPLWSDECFVAVNFIRRGYLDLLRPLDNGQIAPLLYLWAERFVLDLLGFSEWSLRLFPILCGLCSLFLMWRFACTILGGEDLGTVMAVGIFAVSVHPIRHAAEAKPYASDLLVALLLLVPAVHWLRRREEVRWLWALVGLAPVAVLLSNPSVFVAGGIMLGLVAPAWRMGRRSPRLALFSFALAAAVTFLLDQVAYGQDQTAAAIDGLRDYWASSFPPLRDPRALVGWLASAHTGSAFAYPGGGARGASTATFLAFLAGAIVLVRRGDGAIAACLIAPFGLALLAAALHRYPYGSEARLMQFAAPSICLLAGLGAATAIASVRNLRRRRLVLGFVLAGLVVSGVVPQIISSIHSYRMLYDQQAREFARRFWVEESGSGPLACAHLDFQIDPAGTWQGRKAWYLCNQMIYSPGRRGGRLPAGQVATLQEPLRCVVFEESIEGPRVKSWLGRMSERHRLLGVRIRELKVTVGERQSAIERWRIFEFMPHDPSPRQVVAGNGAAGAQSL